MNKYARTNTQIVLAHPTHTHLYKLSGQNAIRKRSRKLIFIEKQKKRNKTTENGKVSRGVQRNIIKAMKMRSQNFAHQLSGNAPNATTTTTQ